MIKSRADTPGEAGVKCASRPHDPHCAVWSNPNCLARARFFSSEYRQYKVKRTIRYTP